MVGGCCGNEISARRRIRRDTLFIAIAIISLNLFPRRPILLYGKGGKIVDVHRKTFDSTSFVWPIYRALKENGIDDGAMNDGYHAFIYCKEHRLIHGRSFCVPSNPRLDVGGPLTELDVLEYAFDRYLRYRDVIEPTIETDAPWWSPSFLPKHLHVLEQDNIVDCVIEACASEAIEKRCGACTEYAWISAAHLINMQIDYQFMLTSLSDGDANPAWLNHMAIRFRDERDVEQWMSHRSTLEDWSHFLSITPRQAFACYLSSRGADLLLANSFDEARRSLKLAQLLDPTNADIENNFGVLVERSGGDIEIAISRYLQAYSRNPDHPAYAVSLGRAYMTKGDHAAAKRVLMRALSQRPHDDAALALLGLIASRDKNYDDAVSLLERIEDKDADVLRTLAFAHSKTGNINRAIVHTRHYLQLKPNDSRGQLFLSFLLEAQQDGPPPNQ